MAVKQIFPELHDSFLSRAEFSNSGSLRLEFERFALEFPEDQAPVFWSGGVLSPTAISVCYLWDGEGDLDELGAEASSETFARLKESLHLYSGSSNVILFINNWGDEFAVFFKDPFEPKLIELHNPAPKPNQAE